MRATRNRTSRSETEAIQIPSHLRDSRLLAAIAIIGGLLCLPNGSYVIGSGAFGGGLFFFGFSCLINYVARIDHTLSKRDDS